MTIIEIPEDLDKRLGIVADYLGLSKEACALQLLEEALDEAEADQEDYRLAVAELERRERAGEPPIPFDEILDEIYLDRLARTHILEE